MGRNPTSDRLDSKAKALGGGRMYDFSQAQAFKVVETTAPDQGKMYKMVLRNGQPMGGVCATLCAFWTVFHAQQDIGNNPFTKDRSVWDYLFQHGGLNTGAATNIVVEHHKSSGNQVRYLESFMQQLKVVPRKRSMSGGVLTRIPVGLSFNTLAQCADHITKIGGYKLISLKPNVDGTGGGHMVSAWCDGGDVLFMDPNFGEFWLPNRASFVTWFKYFVHNTYGGHYKALIVRDYVAAA